MANSLEYISNKKLSLAPLVPEQTINSDFNRLIKMYEDYLNNMYSSSLSGNEVGQILNVQKVDSFDDVAVDRDIQNSINTSINYWQNSVDSQESIQNITTNVPFDYITSKIPSGASLYVQTPEIADIIGNEGISIVEKIYRIADVHDPWLTPFNLLQDHADYMGYDINTNLTNLTRETDKETQQQSRFMVENLPHWYKIKTTEDSIKLLLFSFGLFGGMLNYYTEDYSTDNSKWKTAISYYDETLGYNTNNLEAIPDNYQPTPHFAIWFDLLKAGSTIISNDQTRKSIIKAVNAVKPQSKVFSGIVAVLEAPPAVTNVRTLQVTSEIRSIQTCLVYNSVIFSSVDEPDTPTPESTYLYQINKDILI